MSCRKCKFFVCTKLQCDIKNEKGCNDFESIVTEEIREINKKINFIKESEKKNEMQ